MSIYDRDYMRDEAPSFGERLRQVSAFHWFFWANIAVFAVQWWILPDLCLDHDVLRDIYMPAGSVSVESLTQGHVWTPFTYMFVHGSIGHILLNLIMLWFAGKRVQDLYGPRHFVLIYVLSGLIGATLQIVLSAYIMHQPEAALIGASASVMGLVLAYAVAMPEEEITMLLAFVIPVRVRLWGMAKFLLIINAAFGFLDMLHQLPAWLSGGANVAYFAHVGGALVGWYYARSLGYGGLPSELLHSRIRNKSRRPVMAGNPSVRRPVVEVDMEAVRRMNPRNDPVVDLMRDEVDPILDKISDFGMHSLTDEERRVLERASRKISRTRP
jgi:membrane associated rhomboid family serine protease